MKILIHHTRKSGSSPETLDNVKEYKDTSFWTVEVTFNNNSTENFYGVEKVEEIKDVVSKDCSEEDFEYIMKGK